MAVHVFATGFGKMNQIFPNCQIFKFTSHAVQRMFERSISKEDVLNVLRKGEVIIEYSEDEPFPSYLIFDMIGDRPIHALVALDLTAKICYIITVYEPDAKIWSDDFKKRRKK